MKLTRNHLLPLYLLLISSFAIFTGSCSSSKSAAKSKSRSAKPMASSQSSSMSALYQQAINNSMLITYDKPIDTLWPLVQSTKGLQWKTINGQTYLLMATFNNHPKAYKTGDSVTTTWGPVWLFIPAQMKANIGSQLTGSTDTIQRLCQALGLPPAGPGCDSFITQMWVNTNNLFRPSGNPSITTTTTMSVLDTNVTKEYATWFNNNIIFSYYRPLKTPTDYYYPWTRYGYTYDWSPANTTGVGLCEYVLRGNSGVWVETTTPASAFFKN